MRNMPIDDPTGELEFMRKKVFWHIYHLQKSDNNHDRLMGDWLHIYIKELEKEVKRLKGDNSNV